MTLEESYNQSFLNVATCYVTHWVARGTYVTTNSSGCDPQVTNPWREEFLHWWNMCGAWYSASPDSLFVICSWLGPSHGSVWCLLLYRSWNQREWQTYQCNPLQSQNYWDLTCFSYNHKPFWTLQSYITSSLNLCFAYGTFRAPLPGLQPPETWLMFKAEGNWNQLTTFCSLSNSSSN